LDLIDYGPLMPYLGRYEGIEGEPLRVRLTLRPGSPLAGYDPLHLDNLLARAVVDEATRGAGLPQYVGAYRLPVPLRCLWVSEDGLPLWAATPFFPLSEAVADVAYWHKRQQPGRFTGTKSGKFSISATAGRYMERRVPLPTKLCREWAAEAIGDPAEIVRLLKRVGFVGKRRSSGFGEVERWDVEPLEEFCLVREEKLTRPLPAEAVHLLPRGTRPVDAPSPVGWTPPQWLPSLFRPGWWPGTPVSTDWYEAAGEAG